MIGNALIGAFLNDEDEARTIEEDGNERELPPGVDEVHVVFTQFRSMLVQEPRDIRLLPLEVVEGEESPESDEVLPLYEFEPSPEDVLDGLLPSTSRAASSSPCCRPLPPSSRRARRR